MNELLGIKILIEHLFKLVLFIIEELITTHFLKIFNKTKAQKKRLFLPIFYASLEPPLMFFIIQTFPYLVTDF